MSVNNRCNALRILVVHHDAVVLEDLCETLTESAGDTVVERAYALRPEEIRGKSYDAALIEASRNARTFRDASRTLSQALTRVVWITDDVNPAPDAPGQSSVLRQPFRTEDVTAALKAAGVARPEN